MRFDDVPGSVATAPPEAAVAGAHTLMLNAKTPGWAPISQSTIGILFGLLGSFALIYASVPYWTSHVPLFSIASQLITPTPLGALFCNSSYPSGSLSLQAAVVTNNMLSRALPVGRRDYAQVANGGAIYPPLTSPDALLPTEESLPLESVLSDDVRIGTCWESANAQFQIGVSFLKQIHPTHLTIDHAPLSLLTDAAQAPRQIVLWGVIEGAANKGRYARLRTSLVDEDLHHQHVRALSSDHTLLPLAIVEYDIHASSHVQTFPIDSKVVDSRIDFGIVVLDVVSNWGANSTCLYRFRVHGHGELSLPQLFRRRLIDRI